MSNPPPPDHTSTHTLHPTHTLTHIHLHPHTLTPHTLHTPHSFRHRNIWSCGTGSRHPHKTVLCTQDHDHLGGDPAETGGACQQREVHSCLYSASLHCQHVSLPPSSLFSPLHLPPSPSSLLIFFPSSSHPLLLSLFPSLPFISPPFFSSFLLLPSLSHSPPFSPRVWTHHDNRFLYMLLEYVPGGELFTYLRTAHRFDNPTSLFFASEIVMALDYLHSQNIVYRSVSVSSLPPPPPPPPPSLLLLLFLPPSSSSLSPPPHLPRKPWST